MISKLKLIIRNGIASVDYLERDETVNPIISDCSKIAQKAGMVGKVIYRDLCQRLKFDHTSKLYMNKAENEINEILKDLERQTDHLLPLRRPVQREKIL